MKMNQSANSYSLIIYDRKFYDIVGERYRMLGSSKHHYYQKSLIPLNKCDGQKNSSILVFEIDQQR